MTDIRTVSGIRYDGVKYDAERIFNDIKFWCADYFEAFLDFYVIVIVYCWLTFKYMTTIDSMTMMVFTITK